MAVTVLMVQGTEQMQEMEPDSLMDMARMVQEMPVREVIMQKMEIMKMSRGKMLL